MKVLRAPVFLLSALPCIAATFGTVVPHAQPLADLAIDEARRRLYVVNTASNAIEVYATNVSPPRLTNTIKTEATPLAIAMSRSGRYLYVACYDASALDIIDLSTANFATRSVTLAPNPQAAPAAINEKPLTRTTATATAKDVRTPYDPTADASKPPPPAPA